MNACQQVLARKGRPIVICTKGDEETKQIAVDSLEIPQVPDCLAGILTVIPLQLLSFHLAVLRGFDVSVDFLLGQISSRVEHNLILLNMKEFESDFNIYY